MRYTIYCAQQTFCREVLQMNNKNEMLRKLSQTQFVLWEIHLYLDTHPWDLQMVEKYNKYMMKYKLMLKEYEEKFSPLTASKAQGYEWLKGPWPWEFKECDC